MKYLWIFWALIGVWFLASAATENGLLPSGHGPGRIGEVVLGILAIAYAIFRLKRGYAPARRAEDKDKNGDISIGL